MSFAPIDFVFILFLVFQVKHFLADFCFQNNYMLKKDRVGWNFIYPLATHCGVHGLMTLAICLIFKPSMWWLSVVDFTVHFAMDRFRSSPNYLGRFNNVHTSVFWRVFGFDQMIHHVTHIFIVWMMI
ncbi:MAG: DUF3307 domain-containing protein [Bdellovibrionales bacterium]|nr:DUF3307 domain-containing protein [Bdellovibrionales bacterium]